MKIIKRLPVYAAAAGFTAAVLAVAEARNWSGLLTLSVALGVGAFYVVTILVPWLVREQVTGQQPRRTPPSSSDNGDEAHQSFVVYEMTVRGLSGGVITFPAEGHDLFGGTAETHGPRVVGEREPEVAAR